jgi:VWA domain-containing protein
LTIEFLTPLGWLVAAAVVLPVAAAAARARRERRVRRVLGLLAPSHRLRLLTLGPAVLALALLAAATARPAIRTGGSHLLRTDAQVFFVIDVSRSMLAARTPTGATRFERALDAAELVRARLADVPAGIASLTDRPLPHLFPTGDRDAFTAALHRAIGIQRPPPEALGGAPVATSFDSLAQLASAGYFPDGAKRRLAVLLSDGESAAYMPETLATELRAERVGLVVVRFWHTDERVYGRRGKPERYRPSPASILPLRQLAALTSGRRVFGEDDLRAIVKAARAWLGRGPAVVAGRPRRVELTPYAVLASVVPVAFLLRRRDP